MQLEKQPEEHTLTDISSLNILLEISENVKKIKNHEVSQC